ncbi:MAG: Ig-like domain-containing protein [Clostridiaceae bacterium]|nr:Ig-like domain-containing protein [Clostridiaceae bacterium]
MRKFANKKGMTLIEIIVAIGIIGMIAVIFFSGMTTYYQFINRTKTITQNAFSIQDKLEEEINTVKAKIESNQPVSQPQENITLFAGRSYQVSVTAYSLTQTIAAKSLKTLVANSVQIDFHVPVVSSVTITMKKNTTTVTQAYAADPQLSLTGACTYSDTVDLFQTMYQWYVSRDGYNMPLYATPDEVEVGSKYPRFPDDYEPIAGATTTVLTNFAQYAGHHLVFTATPVARAMKMGLLKYSEPVYLYGPAVLTNLKVHLDSSTVNKADGTLVRTVNLGGGSNANFLQSWPNLAYLLSTSVPRSAAQATPALQPQMDDITYTEDIIPEVWGRQVTSSADSSMTVASFSPANPSALTVIFVAKSHAAKTNVPIIQGTSWKMGWLGSGALGLMNNTASVECLSGQGLDDEWHVFTGIISGGQLKFQVDKQEYTSVNSGAITMGNLTINTRDLSIAELLIYDRDLSTSTDLEQVKTALFEKYDPTIVPWTIDYLHNITDTGIQGETYVMPQRVNATMTNGATQSVEVIWDENVSTLNTGHQIVTGSARLDPTKKVTLDVNVIGIVSVAPISDTIHLYDTYTMPTVVDATYSDGSLRQVPVDWTGAVQNNVLGVQRIDGLTHNAPQHAAVLTVTVIRPIIQSISVAPTSANLMIGASVQLVPSILPAEADTNAVTWSSNRPAVASVSSTGLVTAQSAGTAVIRLQSNENPSAYATCTIRVIKGYAQLTDLSVESVWDYTNIIQPAFTSGNLNYTAVTGKRWEQVDILPTSPQATSITVNGIPVYSGHYRTIDIAKGINTVTIVVKQADMLDQTYTITITRPNN